MSDLYYYYMKLRTGDDLICCSENSLNTDDEFLDIMHPVELITHQIPFQGKIMESMMMQPWVPFTESAMISLPTDSVLLVGEVKEPFLKQYKAFITKIQLHENPASSSDDNIDAVKDFVTNLLENVVPDRIEELEYDDDDEDYEEELPSPQPAKKWLH